ncbi:Arc/MetJ family transcription regulator [Actinoplanes tereljensis]|nr:hypothetical protein [Actinoplanes tereljensis]
MTDLATKPEADVEIDAELLAEAERQGSHRTPNRALNAALRVYVEIARAKRQAAGEALKKMADSGELDFSAFDEVSE